jgi:hypothetical protein
VSAKCLHLWNKSRIMRGHVAVTVLTCHRCKKKMVQTYPNTLDKNGPEERAKRMAAADEVRLVV